MRKGLGLMMWGFQIVLWMTSKNRLAGPPEEVWSLGPPVGDVEFKILRQRGEGGPFELQFRGGGYSSANSAEEAGQVFRSCLRFVSALDGYGFDLGRDNPISAFGADYRSQVDARLSELGRYLVDDVHGLVVYEERTGQPARFGLHAEANVVRNSDKLKESVSTAIARRRLTAREEISCDLLSLVESEGSDRSRLLTLVSALEVLADRPERTGVVRSLVDHFITQTNDALRKATTGADKAQLDSLITGLEDLRLISIGASVRNLATSTRPGDANAKRVANRSYACRSQLIHTGISNEEPSTLLAELLQLVRDAIAASVDRSQSNVEVPASAEQWAADED